MGVRSSKVTRRIAIGSIAGGIAATPFVLRALKGRYPTSAPSSQEYEKEWEEMVRMLSVPIQETPDRTSCVLKIKAYEGMSFRVLHVFADYEESSRASTYPQSPDFYITSDGTLTSVSPVVAHAPALLLSANRNATHCRIAPTTDEPAAEYILVPNDGYYDFYQPGASRPTILPLGKIDLTCLLIADSISRFLPKGEELVLGTKWVVPETSSYCVELPFEIAGFAKLAGRESVKIVAERHLDNQEVQHYVACSLQREQRIEKEAGRRFDADEKLKSRVRAVIDRNKTMTFSVSRYVDVETGLVVRQELTIGSRFSKPDATQTCAVITQLLAS